MEKAVFKPRIVQHTKKNVNFTIYRTRWIPRSSRFIGFGGNARLEGVFQVFTFNVDDEKSVKVTKTKSFKHSSRFHAATFGFYPSPTRMVATGSLDGTLCFWDLDKSIVPLQRYKAHEDVIFCADGCGQENGPPEVATGSADGCVKVWDSRQKAKPVAALIPKSTKQGCWGVAFGNSFDDENRMLVCGYENGDLKFFDLRTNSISWETNLKNGICFLEFDKKEEKKNKLLVTTLEQKFFVFDMKTFNEKYGYTHLRQTSDKRATIWEGRFMPQNRNVFMTAHGHGTLSLWK